MRTLCEGLLLPVPQESTPVNSFWQPSFRCGPHSVVLPRSFPQGVRIPRLYRSPRLGRLGYNGWSIRYSTSSLRELVQSFAFVPECEEIMAEAVLHLLG